MEDKLDDDLLSLLPRFLGRLTKDELAAVAARLAIVRVPSGQLLYRQGDAFKTIRLDYNGGNKYPNLERIAGKPDLITPIYTAR